MVETTAWSAAEAFAIGAPEAGDIPVHFIGSDDAQPIGTFEPAQRAWLSAQNFLGAAKRSVLLPDADGKLAAVAFGIGNGQQGEPCGPSELLAGL
ncbi:MAG: leucyl aminopeptidase family protein, partial [Hyphomicrobium sp.]